jgi:internalin A
MPSNRKKMASALPAALQERIDAVRTGSSTELSLWAPKEDKLTEIPQEVRELTGLRSLSLGDPSFNALMGSSTSIRTLPPWLDELPNLESINIIGADSITFSSPLPDVHWRVDAEQIPKFGDLLDPAKISTISIRPQMSRNAIQLVFDLGRSGALAISGLFIAASLVGGRKEQEKVWPFFDTINSQLDEFLEANKELRELELYKCPIGRIPEPVRQLRALESIFMGGVWPAIIPDWLFEAPELTSLNLAANNLRDLPDALAGARRLRFLGLASNQFRQIPACVWELATLESINLYGCPIEEIPADILRLDRLTNLSFGGGPSGVPTKLVVPPPEIAAQGLDAIRRYWLQERDAGVDYLAEAKLLIVGESGAGKASLAKKILDPGYELDSAQDSTEGIDVMAWQFPTSLRVRDQAGEHLLQRDFRVNVWDFGGQEIYHSTHQFFLTKRSVYVLVTDERKEDTDFEYWLEIVSLLSDGSPLLIAQNRKQGRHQQVDFGVLRQRYPNLCGTLVLDLADNSGLDAAVGRIRRELEQLPHVGTSLPKTWRAVRLALEADFRNYISAADFFAVCQANGFTTARTCASWAGTCTTSHLPVLSG